ncbi:cupin domain-containing protein [Streptomyces sp. NBC_00669]|uniref:JmjC domain-containing protein n=1 Tax=Streptomyces sp. NBC_00669 TaxID=2976011 RepID=UPI002E379836|nr:cupin domain-containing protein [Streptomyces sp. NBC_00669]
MSSLLSSLLHLPGSIPSEWPDDPVRAHRDPANFAHLLTRQAVDALIDADCLAMRHVALLKDSKVVEPVTYADGDMPRRGVLREHLDEGGTLSVRQLERLVPAIAHLQQALHAETGHLTHVNAYYTPAGAHGLKYHYDPYVTLIIQLSGRKMWPMHPPVVENPVREYQSFHVVGFTSEQRHFLEHTPPDQSHTLEPGDVMWLPRGWVHSPYTVGDEPSLHLTVAIKERTPHWAVSVLAGELLAQALVDPAMRRTIVPADLLDSPESPTGHARAYLLGALLKADEKEMAEVLRRAALVEG